MSPRAEDVIDALSQEMALEPARVAWPSATLGSTIELRHEVRSYPPTNTVTDSLLQKDFGARLD